MTSANISSVFFALFLFRSDHPQHLHRRLLALTLCTLLFAIALSLRSVMITIPTAHFLPFPRRPILLILRRRIVVRISVEFNDLRLAAFFHFVPFPFPAIRSLFGGDRLSLFHPLAVPTDGAEFIEINVLFIVQRHRHRHRRILIVAQFAVGVGVGHRVLSGIVLLIVRRQPIAILLSIAFILDLILIAVQRLSALHLPALSLRRWLSLQFAANSRAHSLEIGLERRHFCVRHHLQRDGVCPPPLSALSLRLFIEFGVPRHLRSPMLVLVLRSQHNVHLSVPQPRCLPDEFKVLYPMLGHKPKRLRHQKQPAPQREQLTFIVLHVRFNKIHSLLRLQIHILKQHHVVTLHTEPAQRRQNAAKQLLLGPAQRFREFRAAVRDPQRQSVLVLVLHMLTLADQGQELRVKLDAEFAFWRCRLNLVEGGNQCRFRDHFGGIHSIIDCGLFARFAVFLLFLCRSHLSPQILHSVSYFAHKGFKQRLCLCIAHSRFAVFLLFLCRSHLS